MDVGVLGLLADPLGDVGGARAALVLGHGEQEGPVDLGQRTKAGGVD
ncbi:MAG: hypothetical protein QM779_15455 [Propionicimonas sp.]